jgi:hypothetical protein
MTKPEKRWQLLLVADDGRIIPFRHIRGIALTLLILLVLLGLACAGLGWQLNREKGSHRQTLDQLAAVKKEAAHYKSENEFINAELVLAEARMEKAGLPIPKREVRTAKKAPEPIADDTRPHAAQTMDDPQATPAAEEKSLSGQANRPSAEPTPSADLEEAAGAKPSQTNTPMAADQPVVAVGALKMEHDLAKGMLKATFRLNNNGPRSSPVAGRCLVVLKNDQADPTTWRALPDGALVNGKPDADKGKVFKIFRFIDMDMEAALATDPSVFNTATIYVFDDAGSVLLKKDVPISLPALTSEPEGTSSTAGQSKVESLVGGGAGAAAVTLSRFEMELDSSKNVLRTTFRLSNNGPRSSPVAGRWVVVLKNDQMAPVTWVAMPDGAMVNGKPDEAKGHPFRISRFKDMEIEVAVGTDPSVFNRASVYVFGMGGAMLLEESYPIRLPATVPTPGPSLTPSANDEPAADDMAAPPTDDPPVVKETAPPKTEDSRTRF